MLKTESKRLSPSVERAAQAALDREAERMLKAGWRMVDGQLVPPIGLACQ